MKKANETFIDAYGCENLKCKTCYGEWNFNFERPYIETIKDLLPTNSVGIDIGSHIGLYPILLKDKIKEMHCFELLGSAFNALKINSEQYQIIKPYQIKISDGLNDGQSIDSLKFLPEKINFIKIDTEGDEINILNGAKTFLLNQNEYTMLIEFEENHFLQHGFTHNDFKEALINCGLNVQKFFEEYVNRAVSGDYMTNILIHKTKDKTHFIVFSSYGTNAQNLQNITTSYNN